MFPSTQPRYIKILTGTVRFFRGFFKAYLHFFLSYKKSPALKMLTIINNLEIHTLNKKFFKGSLRFHWIIKLFLNPKKKPGSIWKAIMWSSQKSSPML